MRARPVHFQSRFARCIRLLALHFAQGEAQTKSEKTFNAIITDTQGIETEVKNVFFIGKKKSARPPSCLMRSANCR